MFWYNVTIMSNPVRMCIHCRGRFLQTQLIRLQCQNNQIRPFSGVGRSFYLCMTCLADKKLGRRLAKQCKNGEYAVMTALDEHIKEIAANG